MSTFEDKSYSLYWESHAILAMNKLILKEKEKEQEQDKNILPIKYSIGYNPIKTHTTSCPILDNLSI